MHYVHTGSVHLQGAANRPLITILPSTLEAMRGFQHFHPNVNMTVFINEAINNALEEKEQSIRSLERVGEQLLGNSPHFENEISF